ncbi:MAG: hypothetical protein A3E87_01685 [Gammaproteobacteria bacterium RIFCSPHIGHO2_12_FULL_35_23]|nr:MAG: hypothetical protein A3E87_01685 [Gammaproteobacteria bacterium RIFCSPHIGHO2_12_FULL_35_23]
MSQLTILKIKKKQEDFCINYLMHGNAHKAALEAGYAKTNAQKNSFKWVTTEPMKTYIEERMIKKSETLIATRDWKIDKLIRIVESALQGQEVTDRHGEVRVIVDHRAAIAAIAELNKMCGDYSAEKHINVNLTADMDVSKVRELLQTYKKDY